MHFTHPLHLAGARIDRVTLAVVTITASTRDGRTVGGTGASMLSVPWAWPGSALPWADRDTVLRALTRELAVAAERLGPADAFAIHDELTARTADLTAPAAGPPAEPVPALATALALGAVDNAVHDAWSRSTAAPGAAPGRSPDRVPPRRRLPVQHVVGVDDPLGPEDPPGDGGQPSLRDWLLRDGIRHVKVKLAGRSPRVDAGRVGAVYPVRRSTAPGEVSLSLDPNEGYREAAGVLELLDRIRADHPAAFDHLRYLEQPMPREAPADPAGLRAIGRRRPVLIDEGLATAEILPALADLGWSGLVVKGSRGQSLALRSHGHARQHGLFVTVQDLTAVDLALAHSARLASVLELSAPAFEYNSRQYAPAANTALAARRPELIRVRDGCIDVGDTGATSGIY